MIVQTVREISLDVSKNQYIRLDVKQYDRNTRYILITCYHQGEFIPMNKNIHFASIRYWKPDERGVFNTCEITEDGKIKVELTEQMLAVAGLCRVDVIIHENIDLSVYIVEKDNGEIEIKDINESGILSTMTFNVHVHEAAFDNELVESSYEYNALNDLMNDARKNYWNIATECLKWKNAAEDAKDIAESARDLAKEYKDSAKDYSIISQRYAVGGTGTVGEDTDNAKWYYQESLKNADSANESEENASKYRYEAMSYAVGGTGKREGEDTDNAKWYYQESLKNADSARDGAYTALDSKEIAIKNANKCVSYAVGGTGKREGEDTDNAKWYYQESLKNADSAREYYELSKATAEGLVGGFIPVGTITFEDLATAEKVTGYVYNIKDDFVTDDTFAEGSGKSYTAGVNVYCRSDGMWDCLGGSASVVATVGEVEDYLGI